jgi:stage V sporulation protein AC
VGTLVPITGFANSMASAAIESKSEGLVLGIMTNLFKLAGAVITAGVVSAIVFGFIKYVFRIGI